MIRPVTTRPRRALVAILAAAVAALPAGPWPLAQGLPDLGDSAQKLMTPAQERRLGETAVKQMRAAGGYLEDPEVNDYLNELGRKLVSARPDTRFDFEFFAVPDPSINAFAMPGGTVIVSHGLVKRLASESELAGVLAHEIAHVLKRHQIAAIQSGAWGDVGKSIGSEVIAQSRIGRNDVLGLKTKAAELGVNLVKDGFFLKPLDRGLEYEADRIGVVIATRGGYDPYGLVAVLTMLATVKPEDSGASITFSTHPSPADRIAELEKVVPASLEQYARQPQVDGRFRQAIGAK